MVFWLLAVFAMVWNGPPPADRNADTALVLGAAIDGDQPSPVFAARIDYAIDLLAAGRVQRIVLTGGVGEGETLSEAEIARDYALERDVAPQDIWVETASGTTMENLAFAQPVNLGKDVGTIIVVSDPLHLTRAMQMALDLGYDAVPGPTPYTRYQTIGTQWPFALREVYFLHHYWLFGE